MALRMIEMALPEDIAQYAHEYLRDQGDLPIDSGHPEIEDFRIELPASSVQPAV